MKNLLFILTIFLTQNFPASANDNHTPNPPNLITPTYQTEKIFFKNTNSDLLFVDLETIHDKIIQINVIHNGNVLMEEDVSELPQNTIHEVELSFFGKGIYLIELVTKDGISILKKIKI